MVILAIAACVATVQRPTYIALPDDDSLIALTAALGSAPSESAAAIRRPLNGSRELVVSCGGLRKLVAADVTLQSISPPSQNRIFDVPAMAKGILLTDNQIVRLADGSLLQQRDGGTYDRFPGTPPPWAGALVTLFDRVERGMRGCLSFARSSAPASWQNARPLDFGVFEDAKYGHPRPMSDAGGVDVSFGAQGENPDGTPKVWVGGGDRTELYACPFTHNVYATTRVISGPVTTRQTKIDTMLVLGSANGGATWKLLATLDGWSPGVMTSTRDGRLWISQQVGGQFKLTVSGPAPLNTLPQGFTTQRIEFEGEVAVGPEPVEMFVQLSFNSIARQLDGPSVLLSYQVKNADLNQEMLLLKATRQNDGSISVVSAGRLKAWDPATHSVMYAAFIQPELMGEQTSRWSDDTLIYWYEAPKTAQVPNARYSVRYAFLRGGVVVETGSLSRRAGLERTWTARFDPGDYMKGTSFIASNGKVVFVPQWPEADGLHATLARVRA